MKGGFLVTSIINREDKSFREFCSRFRSMRIEQSAVEVSCSSNFEKLLADELKALKAREDFAVLERAKSILVLSNRTRHLPTEIFGRLRSSRTEFCSILRVIPLDFFARFNREAIEEYILKNKFEGTYKVMYEGRLCPSGLKEKMLQIIVPLVHCRVKLEHPDFLIIVQAFKSFVGLTVMKNVDGFNFSSKEAFQSKCKGGS